jgi:hypothetical protein
MWICSPWENSQENCEKRTSILAIPPKPVKHKPSATSYKDRMEKTPFLPMKPPQK